MPGGLEFYAGAELFSKKQFDVSFRTKLFCFIFIMGQKLQLFVHQYIMRLHAACNNIVQRNLSLQFPPSPSSYFRVDFCSDNCLCVNSNFFVGVGNFWRNCYKWYLSSISNYLDAFTVVRSLPSCHRSGSLLVSFIFVLSVPDFFSVLQI